LWNNGTIIKDPTFQTSDQSDCQQMTWPLTYDDGINLRPKECGSGIAHYICRIEQVEGKHKNSYAAQLFLAFILLQSNGHSSTKMVTVYFIRTGFSNLNIR